MTSYEILKTTHASLGALALLAFWTAGLARKGSLVHRRAGSVFLLALAAILATTVPMVGYAFARGLAIAPFLAFLVLITATAGWTSWRAIRDQRDYRAYTGPVYRALALLNLAGGAGILALGVVRGSVIYAAFALLGLASGYDMLRKARGVPVDARWWLREHYRGMLGNGIATHIAFLAIGLPRLLPQLAGATLQLLAWLAPVAIALAVQLVLERRYRPRTATRAASPRTVPS